MKTVQLTLLLVFAISIFLSTKAQDSLRGIKYQAVARNISGNTLPDYELDIRINLLSDSITGTVVWEETHTVTTNQFGLFSLVIGTGDPGECEAEDFGDIAWGDHNFFLKTEMDAGSGYSEMGISEILSVPYAYYAETSGGGRWIKDSVSDIIRPAQITGISNYNSCLFGEGANTHVNLGLSGSITGVDGSNIMYCTVSGGKNNSATGMYSVVAGGNSNNTEGQTSAILGGSGNTITGSNCIITGGTNNSVSGSLSAIGGGLNNVCSSSLSVISGGQSNNNSGQSSVIGGGVLNFTYGSYSTVAGGNHNTATGQYSGIGGGNYLEANAYNSFVIGRYNVADGTANSWIETEPLFEIGNGTNSNRSNAFTVLKNSNTGIGLSTPGHLLHLYKPLSENGVCIQSDTMSSYIKLNGKTEDQINWELSNNLNDSTFRISFGENKTAKFIIDTAGNIGIGEISPARPLHINDVLRIEPRNSPPDNPAKGDMYMDDADNKLKVYDGIQWQECW